jgi:hypothetical protein
MKLKDKIENILKKYDEEKIDAKKKINLTDEDAKLIQSKGRIEANYNCQCVTNMDGVLVGQFGFYKPNNSYKKCYKRGNGNFWRL